MEELTQCSVELYTIRILLKLIAGIGLHFALMCDAVRKTGGFS
jgi:hypothetical protein